MNKFKVEKCDHGYAVMKQKSSGEYGREIIFDKKEDAVKYAEGNGKLEGQSKAKVEVKSAAPTSEKIKAE